MCFHSSLLVREVENLQIGSGVICFQREILGRDPRERDSGERFQREILERGRTCGGIVLDRSPTYHISLKSCIVHHRSQNPSPELALKLEVWTNHRPGLAMLGSDWSKLASSSQAPGLGFDFCVELCNFLGLHIQGLPKNN